MYPDLDPNVAAKGIGGLDNTFPGAIYDEIDNFSNAFVSLPETFDSMVPIGILNGQ